MKGNRIAIVGGGPSGLMAAITAAGNGAQVILFEKLNRVGKKILATGNGRCNLTNVDPAPERYHGQAPKFIYGAFGQFGVEETIQFFEFLGIHCKTEEEGKVYPSSDQASSVLDVLRYEVERLGVTVRCDTQVIELKRKQQGFLLITNQGSLEADRVILATGGMASPQLGSDGKGYQLALKLGHKLVPVFPALVQIKLDSKDLKHLKGVKFMGEATLCLNQTPLKKEAGEILFTEYGISGPPILQLSRMAAARLAVGEQPVLSLDLFPGKSRQDLVDLLAFRFACQSEKTLEYSLVGLVNKKLIGVLIKEAGLGALSRQAKELSHQETEKLGALMKLWRFPVTGTQSWQFAQATAGGIGVDQVNPKTLESKVVKGLYFAGEILDIDGDCGGFNLQWAWSSGYVAGTHASSIKTERGGKPC